MPARRRFDHPGLDSIMIPDKTARLLIIDDAPENILIVSQMLQYDYRVHFATAGPEALTAARTTTTTPTI